ncbi:MAG: hypothetical protein WCK27_02520 [Verrucomicrobiota bacterium]
MNQKQDDDTMASVLTRLTELGWASRTFLSPDKFDVEFTERGKIQMRKIWLRFWETKDLPEELQDWRMEGLSAEQQERLLWLAREHFS